MEAGKVEAGKVEAGKVGAGQMGAGNVGAERWEPERPGAKSLWLLPSGSDQVGEDPARPTPACRMAAGPGVCKLYGRSEASRFCVSAAMLASIA